MLSITIRMQCSYTGMLSRNIRILYIDTRMLYSHTRMLYFIILLDTIIFFHTLTGIYPHDVYANAYITVKRNCLRSYD